MKRLMSASLKAFIKANPDCTKADLFLIELPNGQTLYATEGQWDITVPQNTPGWTQNAATFSATQYGRWTRGKITSEASVKLASNNTTLTCIPQPGTQYPGLNVGILFAALNHLFDGAVVWIYTAYMALGGYGNVSAGIETKGQFTITSFQPLGRGKVAFECADPLFLLNLKVPSRLLQANCPWSFADRNCTLNPSNYETGFACGAGSTQTVLTSGSGFAFNPGIQNYYTLGVITCLTGANKGLSQTIKAQDSLTVTVAVPWLLPVQPGDTFSMIKGCDKTLTTCANTVHSDGTPESQDFRLRFGGQPFTPPATSAVGV